MRVAVVHQRRPQWPKFRWVHEALVNLGHEVVQVRTIDELAEADKTADVVLFSQRGAGLNHTDVIRLSENRRAKWVTWQFDLAVLNDGPFAEQLLIGRTDCSKVWHATGYLQTLRVMDTVFVKERDYLGEYSKLGVNAKWLDQACPSWITACEHRECPEWDAYMFGCRGRPWKQRRRDVTSLFTEGFVVAWSSHRGGAMVPPGVLGLDFCAVKDLPTMAGRAAVTLGVDYRHDITGYWSDRFWLALGMGSYHLRRSNPGLPSGPYTVYSDHNELVAQLTKVRADKPGRARLGAEARQWVMDAHTYERRCRELLEQV